MTLSEAKKKGNKKWDNEHLNSGSYKMKNDLYTRFEKYYKDTGKSKNSVINDAIKRILEENEY